MLTCVSENRSSDEVQKNVGREENRIFGPRGTGTTLPLHILININKWPEKIADETLLGNYVFVIRVRISKLALIVFSCYC